MRSSQPPDDQHHGDMRGSRDPRAATAALVASVVVLTACVLVWLVPRATAPHAAEREQDMRRATRLAGAAAAYRVTNDGECPSIEALEADVLVGASDGFDTDGIPFHISCSSSRTVVTGAGPDHQSGTEDDITVDER